MSRIPRDESIDGTLGLIRDPYGFVQKRCQRYGADLFETRLLLRRTICMTGPEAAQLFYDPDRFRRRGAMPGRVRRTLLGVGGVQGMDGEAHRHRKHMFMSLMTPERIAALGELAADQLRLHAERWASMERVVLYSELQEVLTRAVCAWSGVPLPEAEVDKRTRELTAMFDAAGTIGPRHWWSRLARRRAETWIAGIVEQVRAGRLDPSEHSALRVIALHRDLEGKPLSPRIAAVEVLNVLRPTVAASVFITLAAHAMHEHPECRQRLQAGEAGYADLFVQEVRRFYPFFPSVMARTRRAFEWKGYHFPEGVRVMLDLYGTDHDSRSWDAPEAFRPERFRSWDKSPFNFIPQGGGDHHQGHRCPGEWITIALMNVAVDFLARRIAYDVPEQDLRMNRSRLPALPQSRFVISNVRVESR